MQRLGCFMTLMKKSASFNWSLWTAPGKEEMFILIKIKKYSWLLLKVTGEMILFYAVILKLLQARIAVSGLLWEEIPAATCLRFIPRQASVLSAIFLEQRIPMLTMLAAGGRVFRGIMI